MNYLAIYVTLGLLAMVCLLGFMVGVHRVDARVSPPPGSSVSTSNGNSRRSQEGKKGYRGRKRSFCP